MQLSAPSLRCYLRWSSELANGRLIRFLPLHFLKTLHRRGATRFKVEIFDLKGRPGTEKEKAGLPTKHAK
jgi:hypothetical protein